MVFSFSEVECALTQPIQTETGARSDGLLSQFLRVYYVRARSPEEASDIVRHDVADQGAHVIAMDKPLPRRLYTMPLWVIPHVLFHRGRGVLWRSGRIFFPGAET